MSLQLFLFFVDTAESCVIIFRGRVFVEERMSRGILSANENDVKDIASVEAYIIFASVNSQLLRHLATNEAVPVYFGRRH